MAGALLSGENFQEIIDQYGYPIVAKEYAKVESPHGLICRDLGWENGKVFGDKWIGLGSGDDLERREELENVATAKVTDGWPHQIAVHTWDKKLVISEEMRMAGGNRVAQLVESTFKGFGRSGARLKAQTFASMFELGTAANAIYNQSYKGEPDPNPTLNYNGSPIFTLTQILKHSAVTPANLLAGSALSAANLQALLVLIEDTSAVSDKNEKITIDHTHLMIPRALEQTALQILNSELIPGSAAAGQNDVNTMRGRLQPLVNRWLTSAVKYYTLATQEGWVMIDSGQVEISAPVENKDNNSLSVYARTRFGFANEDWRSSAMGTP